MKNNQAILIVVAVLLIVGLSAGAYFFFFKKQAPGTSAPVTSSTAGNAGAGGSAPVSGSQTTVAGFPVTSAPILNMTLQMLKSKNWRNQAGATGLASYIAGYDATSGTVYHTSPGWTGKLINENVIKWTKKAGGILGAAGAVETDTWTAI